MGARIKHIEVYFPEKIVSNEDLSIEFPEWQAGKIEEKVGVRSRHISLKEETAVDLAFKAGEKLLATVDRNEVDFLIVCTQSPDFFLPTSACVLQDRLKLRKSIGAFDFNLGCSGFVYGLGIAKSLISSGIANSVLLITAETYSKHLHVSDKVNRSIFGDGASATFITCDENDSIHEFVFGTDGRGKDNLIVKRGGLRHDKTLDLNDPENFLYMNGPEIFNFTLDVIPGLVNDTLERNHLAKENINYYIFHQANRFMLDYLRKKMNINVESFYNNIISVGNTVSSTIPIALKDCVDNGIVHPNDKVLLAGFGVGYSWGAVVISI